jgi:hypothetical protein
MLRPSAGAGPVSLAAVCILLVPRQVCVGNGNTQVASRVGLAAAPADVPQWCSGCGLTTHCAQSPLRAEPFASFFARAGVTGWPGRGLARPGEARPGAPSSTRFPQGTRPSLGSVSAVIASQAPSLAAMAAALLKRSRRKISGEATRLFVAQTNVCASVRPAQ